MNRFDCLPQHPERDSGALLSTDVEGTTLPTTARPGYEGPVEPTPFAPTAPADTPVKPLLRGWSHGFAAGFAIALAWEL